MQLNKIFLTIAISVTFLIVVFMLVLPSYHHFNDMQQTLMQKQAEYEGKFIYFTKIAEIIKNIQSRKDELDKIDTALPPDFSFAPIVYFLQKKGTETGLQVKSITFSSAPKISIADGNTIVNSANPDGGKNIKTTTFTVDLGGNYQGLKNFIYSVENSARLFQIVSISSSLSGGLSNASGLENIPNLKNKDQEKIYDFNVIIQTNTY